MASAGAAAAGFERWYAQALAVGSKLQLKVKSLRQNARTFVALKDTIHLLILESTDRGRCSPQRFRRKEPIVHLQAPYFTNVVAHLMPSFEALYRG